MDDDDDFMCLGNVSPLHEVCRNSTEAEKERVPEKPFDRETTSLPGYSSSEDEVLSNSSDCGSSGDLEDYLCEITEIEQSSLYGKKSSSPVDNVQSLQEEGVDLPFSGNSQKASVNIASVLTDVCVQSMVSLEKSESSGGMLVEPNGFDKASLVLDLLQSQERRGSREQLKSGIIESSGTIILTVQALVNQWTCLLKKNGPRNIKVFSGNVAKQNIFEIAQYDFVVTSYTHIYRHLFSDPNCSVAKNLFFISWERVIYDEVSTISSYGKSPFEYLAFGLLNAKYRWVFSSSQHLNAEAFKKLSLYIFLLQHPLLSSVDNWHALSLGRTISFEEKIATIRNIELPEEEKYSSLFMEALKPLEVKNQLSPYERLVPQFSTGPPMVYLQRVKVVNSPQEAIFYRCLSLTIRRKLSAERNSIAPYVDNGMDYFSKLFRIQVLELSLQLRKACASPQIALQYLYTRRNIFRGLSESKELTGPGEEAKVRMLKKKLGIVEGKKVTDKRVKNTPQRTYAIENLRCLENESSAPENSADAEECRICFSVELKLDGVFLPCGHQLCSACCKRIISDMRKCPFCKNRAEMKDIVSIQAIKHNAKRQRSEVVEEAQSETIEDIDLKEYLFCESSKSQQLARDIVFVMDHRKENNLPRPRCLVITEFSEYNLSLCNSLQREGIATTVLKPSFRSSVSYSRLAKGTSQINQTNLTGDKKAYRLKIKSSFEKEAFASPPSVQNSDIVYENDSQSVMTTFHHNSEEIRGSVVIMNYTLLHLGIDLSWVDYLFIMEPLLTGATQLYSFLSRMTSSRRSDPVRVTMYERADTFDEVLTKLIYKNRLDGITTVKSQARKKFLSADKLENTGLMRSSASEDKREASFDISSACLHRPIDEILQVLGFTQK